MWVNPVLQHSDTQRVEFEREMLISWWFDWCACRIWAEMISFRWKRNAQGYYQWLIDWGWLTPLAQGSPTGRRKILSWLHPQCPVRGDPTQSGASSPAALPSPCGPQGRHSQRCCHLSAPLVRGLSRWRLLWKCTNIFLLDLVQIQSHLGTAKCDFLMCFKYFISQCTGASPSLCT